MVALTGPHLERIYTEPLNGGSQIGNKLSCEPRQLFRIYSRGFPNRFKEGSNSQCATIFAAVLPVIGDLPIRRLPDLTPYAWVAHHSIE